MLLLGSKEQVLSNFKSVCKGLSDRLITSPVTPSHNLVLRAFTLASQGKGPGQRGWPGHAQSVLLAFSQNSLHDKGDPAAWRRVRVNSCPNLLKFMFQAYRTSFNPQFPVVFKQNQTIQANTIISILTRESTLLLFR